MNPADKDEIWRRLANEKARGAEYDSNERRPFSECLPGTRIELLNTLDDALSQEEPSHVWLFGGPGSGKSSVAHAIAERLRAKDQLAATFFFSRKHVSRSNADHVLPAIAYQVGLIHHRAKEAIVKAIRDDPELLSPEKSRRTQFDSLVATPLRELQLVWKTKRAMIFDAADEGVTGNAARLKDLVCMFAELVRDSTVPISAILFTSRPLPSLESLATHANLSNITIPLRIESFDASRDVEIFLRHSFRDIYEMRDIEFVHTWPWPPEFILAALLSQVRGQFIVAATISRLVCDASDPNSAINVVSSLYSGNVTMLDLDLGNIDTVYRYILSDCELHTRRTAVECLSDIIALAEPLSLLDVCKLRAEDVRKCITHLSAVMQIPSLDSSATVQIYHTSLRDYLWDSTRSREHHVDPAESHRRLVSSCLRLMQRELKKDICGLGDPSKLHSEIEDFERRRDTSISGALRYACLYWAYHLERGGQDVEIQTLVLYFLQKQLLFFLEASSIMGCLHPAAACLLDARLVILGWRAFDGQTVALQLLYDGWRLLLQFFEPIRDSALHVYESALPLCPLNTQLRTHYQEICLEVVMSVDSGLDTEWDAVIRTHKYDSLTAFTISPDGRRLATLSKTELRLWDTVTGAFVASPGPMLVPTEVRFSHDGSMLACRYWNGRLCLWYPHTNSVVELLAEQYSSTQHWTYTVSQDHCALAPDDSLIASGIIESELSPTTLQVPLYCRPEGKSLLIYLASRRAESEIWQVRGRFVFPNPEVTQLAVSRDGFVMIITNETIDILDSISLTICRHLAMELPLFGFGYWHCFNYSGDALLHIDGLKWSPENSILSTLLDHDSGGRNNPTLQVVEDAQPLSFYLGDGGTMVGAVLGDYIYTRHRQVHRFSWSGHAHFLSSFNAWRGQEIHIIDLSMLLDAPSVTPHPNTPHNNAMQTVGSFEAFHLLCSRPDKKEAILAGLDSTQPAILHTTVLLNGWKVTILTGAIFGAPEKISVSYNMDMLSHFDDKTGIIHIYDLETHQVFNVALEKLLIKTSFDLVLEKRSIGGSG
ncbi:hypothetical protein CONPUDRAFT_166308 [Coniophora puteana RWD-64-598 SS2]|uniref:Nephrocystin 3-like N-terminal domain-containing protein n=1 Tax=Coniophora puteana (strain RWD-64-598) TaxID=741705 RepID=A0A5M3MLK3_CONPW|nr:uncharacterized protein CONPUDRAFT_166308 [Coniophora puteana RWD-64-598 SS2]EIW79555.1 hypothetical protein CONPUDRAFT_166308 [Coniophora puteana RWD-64-598 SS2]